MATPINSQQNFQKIPLQNVVVDTRSTPPTNPVPGQFWTDTSATPPVVKVYRDGAWEKITNNFDDLPTGTGARNVAVGNDPRFSDQRVPTDSSVTGGTAGTGVKIASQTITLANIALALRDAIATSPSLRTLGFTSVSAMPGDARLNQIAAPNAAVAFGNQNITNLADPVNAQDAATRNYVDQRAQGYAGTKDPVDAVATTNVNIASAPATINGVSPGANVSVLLPVQTTGTQNGIYNYPAAGAAMTRRVDADAVGEIKDGTTVGVGDGSIWIQDATPNGAPGAWTQNWKNFKPVQDPYTAGNGLTLTGNDFNVGVDTTTGLGVDADKVYIATVPRANGGTGATTAAGARVSLGTVSYYEGNLPALTAGTEYVLQHNLNTMSINNPSFRNTTSGFLEEFEVRFIDANNIGITSQIAYPANSFFIFFTAKAV